MGHYLRRVALAAIALLVATAGRAAADEGCCAHCGCKARCQKVCRLVCEDKKVDVTCWGCACEDFCVPGPSHPGCKHCETVCEKCDEKGRDPCNCSVPHGAPKKFVWTEWVPGCAKVHTKKKLMRKVEKVKIKSHKWVVEDLCPQCAAKAKSAAAEDGADDPVAAKETLEAPALPPPPSSTNSADVRPPGPLRAFMPTLRK